MSKQDFLSIIFFTLVMSVMVVVCTHSQMNVVIAAVVDNGCSTPKQLEIPEPKTPAQTYNYASLTGA